MLSTLGCTAVRYSSSAPRGRCPDARAAWAPCRWRAAAGCRCALQLGAEVDVARLVARRIGVRDVGCEQLLPAYARRFRASWENLKSASRRVLMALFVLLYGVPAS